MSSTKNSIGNLNMSPINGSTTFNDNITINENFDVKGTLNINLSNTQIYLPTADKIFIGNTSLSVNLIRSNFPKYSIIMWSNPSNIPSGWVICDGSEYTVNNVTTVTPDLRGRFVVCSGTSFARTSSGGAATVSLTTANIPAHNHGTARTGIESHNHSHSINVQKKNDGDNPMAKARSDRGNKEDKTVAEAGAHSHPLTSTNNTGSSTPFSKIPPYYALIYIMYL